MTMVGLGRSRRIDVWEQSGSGLGRESRGHRGSCGEASNGTWTLAVRDLKTHLSQWLARAQAGEVVEVTSHRRSIARITAVKPVEAVSANPLQNAMDAGIVSWNGQKPVFPPPVRLGGAGKRVSEMVLEDRA